MIRWLNLIRLDSVVGKVKWILARVKRSHFGEWGVIMHQEEGAIAV